MDINSEGIITASILKINAAMEKVGINRLAGLPDLARGRSGSTLYLTIGLN